jgi:hypothetical protein
MKENHAWHFRLRRVVIWGKENLNLPFLPIRDLVDVGFAGMLGLGSFFCGKRRTTERHSKNDSAEYQIFHEFFCFNICMMESFYSNVLEHPALTEGAGGL